MYIRLQHPAKENRYSWLIQQFLKIIVDEVREAQVLWKNPPEQLAIPLDANLDEEPDQDMVAALFRSADAARRAKEAKQQAADVEVKVSAQRKTQEPDVVIEIEESVAAKERGHVVIAIENPNPDLEVKIDHRTKGEPVIGSTVRFQAI